MEVKLEYVHDRLTAAAGLIVLMLVRRKFSVNMLTALRADLANALSQMDAILADAKTKKAA